MCKYMWGPLKAPLKPVILNINASLSHDQPIRVRHMMGASAISLKDPSRAMRCVAATHMCTICTRQNQRLRGGHTNTLQSFCLSDFLALGNEHVYVHIWNVYMHNHPNNTLTD